MWVVARLTCSAIGLASEITSFVALDSSIVAGVLFEQALRAKSKKNGKVLRMEYLLKVPKIMIERCVPGMARMRPGDAGNSKNSRMPRTTNSERKSGPLFVEWFGEGEGP